MKLKEWIPTWGPWSLVFLISMAIIAFAVNPPYPITIGNGAGAPGSSGNAITISAGSLPADLGGFQVYIKYNKNILTPDTTSLARSAAFNALAKTGANWSSSASIQTIDSTFNRLNIQLYDGNVAGTNASAQPVNICTINFSVAASATALNNPLEVETTSPGLGDTGGNPVPTSWVNGNFQVTGIPTGTFTLTPNPASIVADGTATTTVTSVAIKDAANANVPNDTKVTVSTTQGTITTADADADIAGIQVLTTNGIITFALQSNLVVGTATVTANSVTGNATGTTTVPFTAVQATKLEVTQITNPVEAGTASNVQVKAVNAAGVTATGYTGTVRFTSTDANATLPANYTFVSGDAGVKVFTTGVTMKTKGTQSVTATDTTTATITGSQTGIVVNAGPANKITLTANPTTISSSAVSESTLTATIRDEYNNIVTTGAGSTLAVTFTVGATTFGDIKAGETTKTAAAGVATSIVVSKVHATGGLIACTANATGLTQGTVDVTTVPRTLVSIAISTVAGGKVNTPTPKVGETVQFRAMGTYDDAFVEDITATAAWVSSDLTKGDFSAGVGRFFAKAAGATNVTATKSAKTSNSIAMTVQAATPVVIDTAPLPAETIFDAEINLGARVSGGTGDGFNYTVVSGPAGWTLSSAGNFKAGANAGAYVLKVEDKSSLASATYNVKVPFTMTPGSKNILRTATQAFTVNGAGTTYTWDILDLPTSTTPVTTYGTWAKSNPVTDDNQNTFTPATTITDVKTFYIRVTIAGDPDLTEANGLNKRVFGPFRIIPVAVYTVNVKNADGTPLSGALVSASYIGAPVGTTLADGKAVFSLPDTGGKYSYTVALAGYISQSVSSLDKTVNVTLPAVDIAKAISGTVTDTGGNLAGADIVAYLPATPTTQYKAVTAVDGTYGLNLPTGAAATGWTLVASKAGRLSEKRVGLAAGATGIDFSLTAKVGTEPTVDAGGGTGTTSTGGQSMTAAIPVGGVTVDAYWQFGSTNKNVASNFTIGSPLYVWKLDLFADAAQLTPLTAAQIKRVVITLPIDLSVVKPVDLEKGVYVIYRAATIAILEAGGGTAVPAANIISADYVGDGQIGSVTFWVEGLSWFGVGLGVGAGGVTLTDSSSDGRCFIATAAYGSPFEKQVEILRAFRDVYLLPTKAGRLFVEAYYSFSPKAAAFIADSGALRAVVRVALLPVVGLSYLLLQFGALGLFLSLGAILIGTMALIYRRRSRMA